MYHHDPQKIAGQRKKVLMKEEESQYERHLLLAPGIPMNEIRSIQTVADDGARKKCSQEQESRCIIPLLPVF
jgi:hypothetical protein